MRFALAAALVFSATAAHAKHTVAISYFDNDSTDPSLAPLAKGLADMLITDLGNVEALQLVDREKLNSVLAELKLGQSKYVDPKTAVKLGKLLSAEFIMTGAYSVSGEAMRIDARVVNVQTGAVVTSQKVEGKKTEFFALEKDLVDVLVDALKVKLGSGEKSKLRSNPTENYDAFQSYSAGLDAKDKGDDARARELFERALAADPNYRAAKNANERLHVVFARADQQTQASADEVIKSLDPRDPQLPAKVDALLTTLDGTKTKQLRQKIELLTWLAERDIVPCENVNAAATGNPTVIIGGVPAGGRIAFCRPAQEVLGFAMRLADDPTQWEVVPRTCEYWIHRLPGDAGIRRYCETLIQMVNGYKKVGARQQAEDLEEDRHRNYDPDDWRVAMYSNWDGMKKLIGIYAARAPK